MFCLFTSSIAEYYNTPGQKTVLKTKNGQIIFLTTMITSAFFQIMQLLPSAIDHE